MPPAVPLLAAPRLWPAESSSGGHGRDQSGSGGDPPEPPGGSDGSGPSEVAPSQNANERAELDFNFLVDLWLLLRIGTDRHPLAVLLSELGCVAALTAFALWMLPIPAGRDVLSETNRLVGAAVVAPIIALSLVLPLCHLTSGTRSGARVVPLTAHVRRRSLPLLFLCVQMYNIAGFFISIVRSPPYRPCLHVACPHTAHGCSP